MVALWTSCGKHVDADVLRDVVMSDASRRKQAVWVRAGRGVVGRCVVRKAEIQVAVGVRDFVVVSWEMICVDGFDILFIEMKEATSSVVEGHGDVLRALESRGGRIGSNRIKVIIPAIRVLHDQ